HDRMRQKLALRAQVDAAARQAPVPLPVTTDWSAWRYRPVRASGTFDAAHQVLLDNRLYQGRAGYHVLTPLVTADRRTVLVDRGWVAAGVVRSELPRVPPPAGAVTVAGRINQPPPSFLELAQDTVRGAVWQNLDLGRYSAATGLTVLPVIVEQTAPLAPGDTLVREWPAPDLGVEKHMIYMVQWFAFAALAAGLWVYFTFRRKP
ncbi:MAG: SURF1 family protein, partial [Burkholderiales bacterium]|nr:SURF1 family protein [Burkholderiales bacterium]